ncbi:MAG: translocation/assembly module TamB domain-containing protein [Gammaproteobacteria bacterium]|nr:translocation/assembly module TamB domain-containing protein [Gammaproteobacteria bacterium]
MSKHRLAPEYPETEPAPPRTGTPRVLHLILVSVVRLFIVILALLTIVSALLSTASGSRWVVNRVSSFLNDATQQLSIADTEGTLLWGMTLQDVRYVSGGNTVTMSSLTTTWNPFSILSGEFSLALVEADGLQVNWKTTPSSDATDAFSDPLEGLLPLPVGVNISKFRLRNASLDIDEQVMEISILSFAATLREKRLQLTELLLGANPLNLDGSIQIDLVSPYPLRLDLGWSYNFAQSGNETLADLGYAAGRLDLSGDASELIVSHRLQNPASILSEGNVSTGLFTNNAPADQQFNLQHQLPGQAMPLVDPGEGNALHIESAEITTTGWIDDLHLIGVAGLGVMNPAGESILPVIILNWDAVLNEQTLSFDHLSVSTPTGTLNSSGELSWEDAFTLNFTYSLLEQDASSYQTLLPEGLAPGAMASTGSVKLRQVDTDWQGELALDSLTGELNGYPLSGNGNFSFTQDRYEISDLSLRSANNQLQISGNWADTIDLQWQLRANDLHTLSPLLDGSLNAEGSIIGTPAELQLSLEASGRDIVYDTVSIADLNLEGSYSDGSNTLVLQLGDIILDAAGTQRIRRVHLNVAGQPAAHTLELTVDGPIGQGELAASGGLTDVEETTWAGQLQRASIRSELGNWQLNQTVALLLSATQVNIAEHCWVEAGSELCLNGSWRDGGEIDAQAALRNYPLAVFNPVNPSRTTPEAGAASGLIPRLPAGTAIDGNLNAELGVSGRLSNDPAALSVSFNVNAGSGRINVTSAQVAEDFVPEATDTASTPEPEIQEFHWRTATLSGTRENNAWQLNGLADFYQPDLAATGMAVEGNARARLSIDPQQRLDGLLNLAFDELSWIEAFVPQVQNPRGQLTGLAIISGTVDEPRFGGSMTVADGSLEVPALGMVISELTTTMTSDGGETIVIQGQALSGDGTLSFVSELHDPLSENRSLTLELLGNNFELVNLPELSLAISPNMNVAASAAGIDINGTLVLPVLDVQITTLPESAIDVSSDTVLVSQPVDAPEVRNAAQGDRGILGDTPITAELHLVLGDDVRFRGFGLNTQLSGALDITQRATGSPLTYGELTVIEGNYQTYGRTLIIEHGKLLFFGSYDNPALDIRAVRQTENVKVGVQMNGTLRNIRSQLFSTPTLPDGDIIAVLLTDRPFAELGNEDSNALIGAITNLGINQGQGLTNQIRNQLGLDTLAFTSSGDAANSSLTLGKYLTPKIFIRYGVGLFETESTLAVDYSITERVKLEAKSGSTQSIDLTYTVER